MEDNLLVKKRCFDFAFEPKTETESEEDVIIRGVMPKKFRLFGIDIVIQPTIKQEFPDDCENTNPTIALLDYIKSTLGEGLEISDVQILMQKKLERSDMKSHQSRLSIPGKKIKNTDFLTDSEKGWLEGNKSKVWVEGKKKPKIEKNTLSVKVFGSSLLPEHDLDLVRWDYAKNKNGEKRGKRYVLNNGWNQFKKENGLKEGQKILLLSFRHKGRLCFAIVSLEKEKEKEKEEVIKEKKMKKKKVMPIQSYAAGLSWKKSGRPRSRRILV